MCIKPEQYYSKARKYTRQDRKPHTQVIGRRSYNYVAGHKLAVLGLILSGILAFGGPFFAVFGPGNVLVRAGVGLLAVIVSSLLGPFFLGKAHIE